MNWVLFLDIELSSKSPVKKTSLNSIGDRQGSTRLRGGPAPDHRSVWSGSRENMQKNLKEDMKTSFVALKIFLLLRIGQSSLAWSGDMCIQLPVSGISGNAASVFHTSALPWHKRYMP
jgi:hypothetical protein